MTDSIIQGRDIYKKTSSGKTQIWRQEILGSKYRTVSGQIDGKKTVSAWTQAIATNVGRANERDPVAQAAFEVEANYKKKLDKEYHENIEDIEEAKNFLPMLAIEWIKRVKHIKDGDLFYTQPKLDGFRAVLASDLRLMSRNGKEFNSAPHITRALEKVFKKYPSMILDGELYNHDYADDFDELSSIFKTQKPSLEDIMKSEEITQYHLYDFPGHPGVFSERYQALVSFFEEEIYPDPELNRYIKLVPIVITTTMADIEAAYEKFLEDNYEGMMLRRNTPYVNKRTNDLIKRKEFIDEEFTLHDIVSGIGNWAGAAKSAWLIHDATGEIFKAGVKGERNHLKKVLANKEHYIGKPTTVRYFKRTPSGVPRFGRVKEFARWDI